MLTKDKFLSSCPKIPYTKTTVDGLGEVGVRLLRDGEPEKFSKLEINEQVANYLIGDDGERVFEDEDIEGCIADKMTLASKTNVMLKLREVNGGNAKQEDLKKSS